MFLQRNRGEKNSRIYEGTKLETVFNNHFYYDTTYVERDGYKAEVVSYRLKDSVNYDEGDYIYPVCSKQTILLYKNGQLINRKEIKYGTINVSTLDKNKVVVLGVVVTKINLRKGKSGFYYFFRGWGGCNWCTTYEEIFSPSGKSLYLLMRERTRVFESFGNYENVLKRERISEMLTPEEKATEQSVP
jgi:hypothetical protein